MSTEKLKLDVVIVGGGVMGLWCAHDLLRKFPHLSLAVLEAESYLGEHCSGRNSEVLHSGIYYPTGSLKHRHCLEGNLRWRGFLERKNLSFLGCGKIVAAVSGQEEALARLEEQARRNGVPGLRPLDRHEVESWRRLLHIDRGFFCPSSAVFDVAAALKTLRLEVEEMGGVVVLRARARLLGHGSEGFSLEVGGSEVLAANLVNAAGLFAVDFRQALGLVDFTNHYVKGSYLKLRRSVEAASLVYPVPPENGLGLGVHITMDTAGGQKFGPDTEPVDKIDYSVEEGLIPRMAPAIHAVFKNIRLEDLQLGYAGIRPKVKKAGSLLTDFVFQTAAQHGVPGYFEFLGIESPGITASPSLATLLSEAI